MRSQPFPNGSCGIGLGFPTLNRLAWVLVAKLASNFLRMQFQKTHSNSGFYGILIGCYGNFEGILWNYKGIIYNGYNGSLIGFYGITMGYNVIILFNNILFYSDTVPASKAKCKMKHGCWERRRLASKLP